MGRVITSPGPLEHPFQKSIFLAGGISGCSDWQQEVADVLRDQTDLVIYNPRRLDFDMSAYEEVSREQIRWEYKALRISAYNLFWFPPETLCPITLMEFGSAMERIAPDKLLVGVHPDYKRKFDVVEQAGLSGHTGPIYDGLIGLLDATILATK